MHVCIHISIDQVEADLREHMRGQQLRDPFHPERTVAAVLGDILACQGAVVEGASEHAFAPAVAAIQHMLQAPSDAPESHSQSPASPAPRPASHLLLPPPVPDHAAEVEVEIERLTQAVLAKDLLLAALKTASERQLSLAKAEAERAKAEADVEISRLRALLGLP